MARVRIGSAEIDLTLRTGQFTKAVEDVRNKTRSMKDGMVDAATKTRSLTKALAGMTAAGYAAKEIFELGSAVEETASKFATVFGDEAGEVQTAIDQFSTLAGLSKRAAQEVTATTGAIVTGFGLSGRAAADMAVQVSQLAADLASFNNVPIEETARAIQAGLTGEMESLKRLGIAVLDVDVKQKALAMTGKSVVSELSRQEIVTARLALITERAGVQVGDLARTQTTAAAQARILGAEIENIKEELAVALTPALTVVVRKVREFIGGMQLLGVEGAVAIAKFRVAWENSIFGSDEGLKKALDNLHHTSNAAREMRDQIVGVAQAAEGGAGAGGTAGASQSIQMLGKRAIESAGSFDFMAGTTITVATGLQAVGQAAAFAAMQQERLNSAMGKFNAVSGALSFIGRFVPGIGTGVSLLSGAVGAVNGLRGAFSSESTSQSAGGTGEITLNLNVTDPSDGTVNKIRGRIRDFENLNVPLPV